MTIADLIKRRPGKAVERVVLDAELVDPGEARPVDPPPIRVPAALVRVVRPLPARTRQAAQRVGPPLLVAARPGWVTLQGYASWARRAGDAATHAPHRRAIRAAEAVGDRAAVAEWVERLEKAKDARAKRLRELPSIAAGLLRSVAVGAGIALVVLIVGGFAAQMSPGGLDWRGWWATWWAVAVDGRDTAVALLGVVAWLAVPMLLVAGWREGSRVAALPRWLLLPDERETDVEVTPSRVVIALRDLGISRLDKAVRAAADGAAAMLSPIRVAGCGVEVDVTLPTGVDTGQVMDRRRRLAENLSRHEHEVFPSVSAARTVRLWIADPGALDEPIGPSPMVGDDELLANMRTGRAPWGVDLRGDPVGLSLHQMHALVTGLSNQGKTAALRALALWAALDPTVDLWIADLKGVGDWSMFRGLAEVLIEGPTDEHVARATEMLERAGEEMNRRLTEGKSTSRRKLLCIVDEAQVAFMCPEKDDLGRPYGGTKATSRYFRAIRTIHNQGRAVDVTAWQGTQDPTDQNLPKLVREGAHIRACLAVGTAATARIALGDKAVDGGAAPHLLRAGIDKGTLVVHGGVPLAPGQSSVTVRTHFIDDDASAQLAALAKAARKPALPAVRAEQRDLLADVADVLGSDEVVRATDTAARLRELAPEHKQYRTLDGAELAAQLGDLGVEVKRRQGYPVVRLDRVNQALDDRQAAPE